MGHFKQTNKSTFASVLGPRELHRAYKPGALGVKSWEPEKKCNGSSAIVFFSVLVRSLEAFFIPCAVNFDDASGAVALVPWGFARVQLPT